MNITQVQPNQYFYTFSGEKFRLLSEKGRKKNEVFYKVLRCKTGEIFRFEWFENVLIVKVEN